MGLHKNLKLLKPAPTRWLSHGETSNRLVSRFESLVDALINGKAAPDIKGIRGELIEPNTVLMLLLLSDVLAHANRFSRYLQTRDLIYSTVTREFSQLIESLTKLSNADVALFTEFALPFLQLSKKDDVISSVTKTQLDWRRRRSINIDKSNVKTPFMSDLIAELHDALKINDPNNTKHCKFWARIFYSHAIMYKAKESTKSKKHSLMRIILWGPDKIEDTVWESLAGKCKDVKERRIDL